MLSNRLITEFNLSGNQKLRPNNWSNVTDEPLQAAVTAQELADWLGVSADDPLLNALALTGTDAASKFLSLELIERTWVLTYDRLPERQSGYAGLGQMPSLQSWWIDFPIAPLISVDSVTVGGEPIDSADYKFDTKSARLFMDNLSNDGELVVTYVAGLSEVSEIIKTAILMLASYLYEHRGACSVDDAMKTSGAAAILQPYKRIVGGL